MDPTNPFAPTGGGEGNLVDRWRNFFTDPNNAAAIMSFGASLAAPMGFGATRAGHISQALGHAGATMSNRAEIDRKDREADSRIEKREIDADAATRRAQVAEANSNTAAVRAQAAIQSAAVNDELRRQRGETEATKRDLMRQRIQNLEQQYQFFGATEEERRRLMELKNQYLEGKIVDLSDAAAVRQQNADTRMNDSLTRQRAVEQRGTLATERIAQRDREGAANRASRERIADRKTYQQYENAMRRANSDAQLLGGQQQPILPYEEWARQFQEPTPGAPTVPQVPGNPGPGTGAAPTQRAQIPSAPPANQRQVDQIYMTPGGPLRWKGNGFWERVNASF